MPDSTTNAAATAICDDIDLDGIFDDAETAVDATAGGLYKAAAAGVMSARAHLLTCLDEGDPERGVPALSVANGLPTIAYYAVEAWLQDWTGLKGRRIADELLKVINLVAGEVNKLAGKDKSVRPLPRVDAVPAAQLVQVLRHENLFRLVAANSAQMAGSAEDLPLCRYDDDLDSPTYGLHVPVEATDVLSLLVKMGTGSKGQAEAVYDLLCAGSEIVERCHERDYVPLSDGIWHYAERRKIEFSPNIVLLSKASVTFDPDCPPELPVYDLPDGTTWNVRDGISVLAAGDPEIEQILWEGVGASLRPLVRWNKCLALVSEVGNNGKGTYLELVRTLVGPNACVEKDVAAFGDDYPDIDRLNAASVVLGDENDTNGFLKSARVIKSVLTANPVTVKRKYRRNISVTFRGVMIQCLNATPRSADKSSSFYRRWIFVPMRARFEGCEVTEIKDKFIPDERTLTWVAWYVLTQMPAYYAFSGASAADEQMAEVQTENDPVRAFWTELRDEFVWDLLPYPFLHDLYVAWLHRNVPEGRALSARRFTKELKLVLEGIGDDQWEATDTAVRPGGLIASADPLVTDYKLDGWRFSAFYQTPSMPKWEREKLTALKPNYRGLVRRPRPEPDPAVRAKLDAMQAEMDRMQAAAKAAADEPWTPKEDKK